MTTYLRIHRRPETDRKTLLRRSPCAHVICEEISTVKSQPRSQDHYQTLVTNILRTCQ